MLNCFADRATKSTVTITPLRSAELAGWLKAQPPRVRRWLELKAFRADDGQVACVPGEDGSLERVVLGLGDTGNMWSFAALPGSVPAGRYALPAGTAAGRAQAAALGWALASYRYARYSTEPEKPQPLLVWPASIDRAAVERSAEATALGRDLVNTPASDLGPAELADAARKLARQHRANCRIVEGSELRDAYPTVYTVGAAATAARAPRLIDLSWGPARAPKVTLVGKGVIFDSGGLDLKSAANMRLMKKDMGGAAMVLGLSHMIMHAKLKLRLRLLIPAVENAVSAEAYRPGDVIRTRKGLSVEVGNTDAEGRLILCDALAEASTEKPDLLLDAATLTGAARVALGTELPALFTNDDDLAAGLIAAGEHPDEPDQLWRMPLFAPYRRHLRSSIADLSNIAEVPYGGAIIAALFLKEFVEPGIAWAHIDTMAFNSDDRPGRPKGGEVFAMRAVFRMLEKRYPPAAAASTRKRRTR